APAASIRVYAGVVRSTDGPVRARSGPSTRFPIQNTLINNTKLRLHCAATGERATGNRGTTTQWDKTTDGRWISHAYVTTGSLPRCTTVPKPPATLTNAQFIALAVPGAQRGWREYGVPPSITIGQAILESGWGRSALSSVHHNYFGIKCHDKGPLASGCYSYQTFECDNKGKCFGMTDSFRTYTTAANSFRDHGRFLRVNSRYAPAFAHTRSSNKFLYRMWKAGYATDPQYYTKVTSLMKTHKLYQYDTWR
ncbi:sporangiospore maturation cell wall hydrolase GsmA, partial [Pilimelia terevasa]|uniref:sporangiospore maturation cell wall hydrolase GsmA n=1 Tax=Pilimelia terevasa TaxID=53372 RepID=UPI001663F265